MKWIVTISLLCAGGPAVASLAACEGEPPVNMPENPPGTRAVIAVEPTSAASSAAQAVPPAASTIGCPPPPCAPAASAASATVAATPSASASAAEAATSPPETRGDIAGSVTTKPAASAANAVVYLEDAPKDDAPAHLQTVTIGNRQMTFVPWLSVVGVGGKVIFANEDPFPHNVFSPDNEKFNMGNIPQNGAHQRVFEHPGAYSLLCNLHPGMLGYLLVTPTTHYARTDAKGKYLIKHIPAGTYRVTAWAPRQGPVTQSVTVASGEATVNFELHR
jgi:plastocyanin